jgi:hypothetical protein
VSDTVSVGVAGAVGSAAEVTVGVATSETSVANAMVGKTV